MSSVNKDVSDTCATAGASSDESVDREGAKARLWAAVEKSEKELVRFKRRAEDLEDVITLTRKYMKENDFDTGSIADYVLAGGYCPRCCARMDNHASECDYFAQAGADEKKAQPDGAPGATEEPAPVPTVAESVGRETALVLAAIAAVPDEPTEPVAVYAGAEHGEVDASKARVHEVDASKARVHEVDASEVDDSEVEVAGKGKSVQLTFASAAAARAWLTENVH